MSRMISTTTISPCCESEKLSYVLHHSLEVDAAHALATLIEARGVTAKTKRPALSALVIITPFNIPD